jgi:uncharacterized membrane protein YgaE (UPF0421/DUF939 family)
MADGKEIDVNGKVIGEGTKITLSVKTALWIIGGAITLSTTIFSMMYFDVKSDVSDYKKKVDEEKQIFVKQVEESISNKLDKQRDKDEEFIKSIEEIRGNIRLLLDRTQNVRNGQPEGVPTINSNQPGATPPGH